jgi:ferredoxin
MTYIIAEPCVDVMDEACVEVCPVDCIHFEKGVDRKLYIDPDECIDCGACEPACPVSAIFAEDDLPAEQEAYRELEELYFQDKDAARAKLAEVKPK